MNSRERFGWDSRFEEDFLARAAVGLEPARVAGAIRRQYRLLFPDGAVVPGVPAGRLRHLVTDEELPVIGDWVVARRRSDGPAVVHEVLPRHGLLARKAAGSPSAAQVMAANVDVALLVTACGGDWNPRRLERYLSLAWESGARPAVLLTKLDLAEEPEELLERTRALAPGAEVVPVCALDGRGLGALRDLLPEGRTGALLGSSGVGKSTLVNALMGQEAQATGEVRESDQRGRHTTTRRDLLELPWGAWLVDTPGMREVGLQDGTAGVAAAFADVEDLMGRCRFRDCQHQGDGGCAVEAALERGDLDPARWHSYGKLQRERAWVERERRITRRKQEGRRRRR